MPDYYWDAAKGIYRNSAGNPVPLSVVHNALADAAVTAANNMGEISGLLASGAVTVSKWHEVMAEQMDAMYRSVHALSNGGWHQMTPDKWARCDERLETQRQYLARFASQLADGTQPMDGRFALRAEMYAASAHPAFENERRNERADAGMKWERRIIDISAENCDDCVAAADEGWQPIGTLPDIGESTCLTNCRCWFEYSDAEDRPD